VLAPTELIQGTTEKALTKPYFQYKLSYTQVQELLSMLTAHSEIPPAFQGQMRRYGNDRKDDYLVAYALLHNVDYLVAGDRNLLALREIDQLKIVPPAAMVTVLKEYTSSDN
jgi:predicted nucleic acid-binding protein